MERRLVLTNLSVEYEGLVDVNAFFALIDDWFQKNGYHKNEVKHVERVKDKGKFIELKIFPWKEISDYAKYEIQVQTFIEDVKTVTVEKDGKKVKVNKGRVKMLIDAFIQTDWEDKWESSAMFFFLRTIFDKFIHKRYMDKWVRGVTEDVQNFHSEVKSYLNLQEYRPQG